MFFMRFSYNHVIFIGVVQARIRALCGMMEGRCNDGWRFSSRISPFCRCRCTILVSSCLHSLMVWIVFSLMFLVWLHCQPELQFYQNDRFGYWTHLGAGHSSTHLLNINCSDWSWVRELECKRFRYTDFINANIWIGCHNATCSKVEVLTST